MLSWKIMEATEAACQAVCMGKEAAEHYHIASASIAASNASAEDITKFWLERFQLFAFHTAASPFYSLNDSVKELSYLNFPTHAVGLGMQLAAGIKVIPPNFNRSITGELLSLLLQRWPLGFRREIIEPAR